MAQDASITTTSLDEVYEGLKHSDPAWLRSTLLERWQSNNFPTNHSLCLTTTEYLGPFDVTSPDYIASHEASNHLTRLRNHDWASTELGSIASWKPELRRVINLCIRDPRPVAIWWGPSRVCLHNDAYQDILGEKNAWALGKSIWEVWYETDQAIDHLRNALDDAETTGQPTNGANTCFYVERNGFVEEFWASWAVIPILGRSGNIGYYNPVSETTERVQYERRMETLLALEHNTSQLSDLDTLWSQILSSLEPNRVDVPFAALYSLTSATHDANMAEPTGLYLEPGQPISRTASNASAPLKWVLQGTLETSSRQLDLPTLLDQSVGQDVFGPQFLMAIETQSPQLMKIDDGTFPTELHRRATSREWACQCRSALLIPIPQRRKTAYGAFLLLGLNPRSSYDQAYQDFTARLTSQLGRSVDSVSMVIEDARNAEISARLMSQERDLLAERLKVTQLEAQNKTLRFRTMADMALVGMFELEADGKLTYANNTWFEMTGFPRGDLEEVPPLAWTNVIHAADREWFASQWAALVDGQTLQFEVRFSKPYLTDDFIDGERLEGTTWVAAAAYAERDLFGNVTNILGSISDISRHKWMENFQERRMAEAMELKRQQEAFMDMTSHEARNPLAAISLCGESIMNTCEKILLDPGDQLLSSRDTVETTLDSASTIMACVAHQKTIIDDVLMMSKLNSGLLQISPTKISPVQEINEVLKMLEAELQQADIECDLAVDETYHNLEVEHVLLDPVRLRQILINLLTNAIKFTKEAPKRLITINLAASKAPPPRAMDGVEYLPEKSKPAKPVGSAGADRDTIYIAIAVKDSGCGIDEFELAHLFQRFQQGSPKTHVKYGGSGLGLFICKELARLQGGRIGVSSIRDKGSTFAFYVRVTACAPPSLDKIQSSSKTGHIKSCSNRVRKASLPGPGLSKSKPRSASLDASNPDLQDCHILLVEDNLVNQRVMAKQLRQAGFHVTIANHGQEALDHLHTTHFLTAAGAPLDLVLMDIEMPVMNGLECSQAIRELEHTGKVSGSVPLIAVTANARAEQQNEAREAGFDDVITKPFRMSALLPELKRYCGKAAS